MKDKASLYNYYKQLINFRNSCKAFTFDADLIPVDTGNAALSSWIVKNGEAQAFVVHNVSENPASFTLPQAFTKEAAFQTTPVKKNKDGSFTIPSFTSAVFTD